MSVEFGKVDSEYLYSKPYFKRWLSDFDKDFFNGFFEDKKVTLTITREEPFFRHTTGMWGAYAYAVLEDFEICINPLVMDRCWAGEIRDTFLHEMLHLFLYACHPKGRRYCGDNSKAFIQWSRFVRCPICGRSLIKDRLKECDAKSHLKICLYCGEVADSKRKYCQNCRKAFFKTYRKY